MSATSGIPIHDDLQKAFAVAQNGQQRFLKLVIKNESIVLDATTFVQGDLTADLDALQDILDDDLPAYVLAKLDDTPTQWLAITYVPDTAKVRDKMLYASSRNTLTKSLGASSFADTLFATHKSDLTPSAYAAHRRHQSGPNPLSAGEQAMADVQAAERAAARLNHEGAVAARSGHFGGAGVQMNWDGDTEEAVRGLVSNGDDGNRLIVMTVDPVTQTVLLSSNNICAPSDIAASLPTSDPSYAFFAWSQARRRDILFIYSCPSGSPVKHRMIFSSGVSSVLTTALDLGVSPVRKVETSDPREVNEAFLRAELNLTGGETEKKQFAKPRGPARKQR